MKKLFDFNHPFYRPLWLRIAIVSVTSGWGLFEFAMGAVVWGVLFCGLAAAAFHGLFITFDPQDPETDEKVKDQEDSGA